MIPASTFRKITNIGGAALLAVLVLTEVSLPAGAMPAHAVRPLAAAPPAPTPSASPLPDATVAPTPGASGTPVPVVTLPPEPQPTPSSGQEPAGCGWLDLECKADQAITGLFEGLVRSALNPVFRVLARTVLAAPRVDELPRVHSLWITSLGVANTCLVLFVIAGGMLLMSQQSLQTAYTIKDAAPRLVVAVVAANVNLPLIGQAIDFTNALSVALMGDGADPGKAATTLKGLVVTALTDPGLFMPMLGLVTVVVAVIVVITCVVRIMLLVLLTAVAPLALACHALPHTEALARLWWRAIAGVLAIGVAQSLVLATAVRVFFSSDQSRVWSIALSAHGVFDLVLVICLLYILTRIPSWIASMVTRGGMSRSPMIRTARTLAAIWVFRGMTQRRRGRRKKKKKKKRPAKRPTRPPARRPGP